MMDTYENVLPKLVDKLDRDVAHCLTCFDFPQQHRKRIRTTNLLERLNREIKRRADVVQIFPNEQACERLIGALCMEWSDEWISGRRYLDMTYLNKITDPYHGATFLQNFLDLTTNWRRVWPRERRSERDRLAPEPTCVYVLEKYGDVCRVIYRAGAIYPIALWSLTWL